MSTMEAPPDPVPPDGAVELPTDWDIRAARWSDFGEIYRLYRTLPEEERLLYHPFPTGWLSLGILFAALITLRGLVPRFARLYPRGAALLVIARHSGDGALAALGTLNFSRSGAPERLAARTGLYVLPMYRRLGAGRSTNEWMLARARAMGVRRAEALLVVRNEGSRALFGSMGYQFRHSSIRDLRPPFEEFLFAERDIE